MNRLMIAMLVAVSGTAFGPGPGVALGAETTPQQTGGRDAAHLHYSQGVGLLSSGDLLGARAELREALRLQPDLVQARFSLGTALYLSGDVDSAIDAYRTVIRQQPDLAHAHLHLGIALMVTHAWAAAQAGVPQAQYYAGVAYASGTGVERNLASAISWWFLAADQEVPQAKEALASLRKMMLTTGNRSAGEARVVQDAFGAYRRSLWQQVSDLKGRAPDESVGVGLLQAGRIREALPVLLHEAAALSEQAQAQLETLYANGVEGQLAPFNSRILDYFKTAAGEGLPYPSVILARIYAKGLGMPADVNKARGLLKGNPREDAQALMKELSASAKTAPVKKS